MGSNSKHSASALDPLMAGFAAGAAAFIVYAMPQASFDNVVQLSGLPMILPAAEPPLGMTARGAVMIAAAIGSFILVWRVLRALSKPARKGKRSGAGPIEMDPPRLRRADMHPDAPSRRPLLAGSDLGRSFDELGKDDERDEDPDTYSADPIEDSGDEEPQPNYAYPSYGEAPADDYSADDEDHEPELSGSDEPETALEEEEERPSIFAAYTPAEPKDRPAYSNYALEAEAEEAETEEAEAAEAEPEHHEASAEVEEMEAAEQEEEQEIPLPLSPRHVQTVHALSHRLPDPVRAGASIDDLVQRLEAGLARRHPSNWAMPSSDVPNGNGHSAGRDANPLDARLRGAIDELQKLASRGN